MARRCFTLVVLYAVYPYRRGEHECFCHTSQCCAHYSVESGICRNAHFGSCFQIDPKRLINRIPMGMHIEGLRDRLVKIISDYNLQVRFLSVLMMTLIGNSFFAAVMFEPIFER